MEITPLLGYAAAFFTTVCNIPQAIKMIRTRETSAISAPAYIVLFAGLCLWIAYGIFKNDVPIIVANSFSAVICGTVLFLKFTSKKALNDVHKQIHDDDESAK